MESLQADLSECLDSLDARHSQDTLNLEGFDNLDLIILHLFKNLEEKKNLKILRQLLMHSEGKVLEVFIQDPGVLKDVIDWILGNRVNFDSSKLLAELFDESFHNCLVSQELIDSLVEGLAESDEKTCENLVKVLILIGNSYLDKVIQAKNSRFFGEMLVLRVNWAEGTEKKNLIKTIGRIFKFFPEFFYVNDLKLVADTLIKVLNDREEDLLVETYEALSHLMNIQDFVATRHRFDELFEILQHGEDEIALCEIQNNILDTINKV
jgi:hypothetical protein